MKCTNILLYLTIVFFLLSLLTGCANSSSQIQNSLHNYSQMIAGNIPEDLCLTIYYLDPSILTYSPLNVDDLMNFSETQKIIIQSEELMANFEPFKKLDISALKPAREKTYVNARLYYVLNAGDAGNLLEVVITQTNYNVILNGIETEYTPIFHELVAAFLPKDRGRFA